jgi:hypothetical protein
MTISDEIEVFIREHRDHGPLVGYATEPLPNGYQVTVACACRVVFIRGVSPDDAAIDLAVLASRN